MIGIAFLGNQLGGFKCCDYPPLQSNASIGFRRFWSWDSRPQCSSRTFSCTSVSSTFCSALKLA